MYCIFLLCNLPRPETEPRLGPRVTNVIEGKGSFTNTSKTMKETVISSAVNGASTASSAQSTNSYMQYTQYRNHQGHGWAAEDANAMADRLAGKRVEQVGTDNSCNGADRIVNGVEIQTKYCASARESVNAAFQDCKYRYDGMKLEVPKDQYEEAVKLMAEKIRSGQVPGVTDPAVARDMVVKGSCSYQEAKNIAKAGNIDSIKFDMKTQTVTCGLTCGISFVLSYANSVRNGKKHKEALKEASIQAAKNGATSMVIGVGTQQLLRTCVGRNIATSATHASRAVINATCKTRIGQKIVEKTASTLIGKQVAGQTAKNILAKGMRTNMVTGGIMLAAQTVPDAVKVCQGKMSKGQFCENVASNTAGIGGGYAGATIGAAIGSALLPGVGTVVGGFIGGIGGGIAGSSTVRSICSWFR